MMTYQLKKITICNCILSRFLAERLRMFLGLFRCVLDKSPRYLEIACVR